MKGRLRLVSLALVGVALTLLQPTVGLGDEPPADIAAKISGPQDGTVGQTLVYSMAVSNAGPAYAERVVARIHVPVSFTVLDVSFSQGVCSTVNECEIGQLSPGETVTGSLTVRLEVRERTILSLSAASPTTPDLATDNNSQAILFLPPSFGPKPKFPAPAPSWPVAQPELPPAMVGRPYSVRMSVTGGVPPYRFVWLKACTGSDPEGLTLSEDGLVSFTPVGAGEARLCLKIYDSVETTREHPASNVSLRILEPLVVQKLPDGLTGSEYGARFVSGGQPPYSVEFRLGRLPPGVKEVDGFARVTGAPTVSGRFALTSAVTDSLGFVAESSQVLRIRVGRGRSVRLNEAITSGRVSGRAPQCLLQPPRTAGPVARLAPGVRSRLLDAYGVWWRPHLYVIDRLIPVELGGHPTHVSNLWPQLAERARRTDNLERFLLRKVCAGQMSLRAAQERIASHKTNVG